MAENEEVGTDLEKENASLKAELAKLETVVSGLESKLKSLETSAANVVDELKAKLAAAEKKAGQKLRDNVAIINGKVHKILVALDPDSFRNAAKQNSLPSSHTHVALGNPE